MEIVTVPEEEFTGKKSYTRIKSIDTPRRIFRCYTHRWSAVSFTVNTIKESIEIAYARDRVMAQLPTSSRPIAVETLETIVDMS